MHTWLIKTEPGTWSWDQQVKVGVEPWNGVRNYQAQNNLRRMEKGDQAFFYHSVKERQIVGIVEIIRTFYPDPTDPLGRFGMVDVKALKPLKYPIFLVQIKADPRLQHLALIRQSRLSVMEIDIVAWEILCQWGMHSTIIGKYLDLPYPE